MRVSALIATACAAVLLTGAVAAQQERSSGAPNFRLVGTIRDLMNGVVDPPSDRIWSAVWTEDSVAGVIEHQPKTDEEWTALEHDALTLAEAANLLKMPG